MTENTENFLPKKQNKKEKKYTYSWIGIGIRIIIFLCFLVLVYFYFFPEKNLENTTNKPLEKLPPQPRITQKEVENIQNNIEKNIKEAETKHEERKKKGDTTAITDKKLAEYLPQKPLGLFEKTNKSTQNPYNMSGQKIANAEQEYRYKNAFLRINLIDYNAGNSPDVETSAYWTKALSTETDTERSAGFALKNEIKGWEIFFKKKKMAEVTLAISDRFTLILKANQQTDCEILKNIASEMLPQLEELAKK